MNRLKNYFSSSKLSKSWLHSAEEYEKEGEREKALKCLINSQRDLITAMNNVASIAFHQKPQRGKS